MKHGCNSRSSLGQKVRKGVGMLNIHSIWYSGQCMSMLCQWVIGRLNPFLSSVTLCVIGYLHLQALRVFIVLRVMWLNGAPRQLGPCGFTETYICRMWARLLGCILREAHCNNREGERRDSEAEEEEEEERGKRRGRVKEFHFHNSCQSHNAILLESLRDVAHNQ